MMLNPGKCHFMLFGFKENEQFDMMCNDIILKQKNHDNILGVVIGNKLSFDEHINHIWKTVSKNLNALGRINHYKKQNQKEILLSSFIIFHIILIWMFCSNKSAKKINHV